MTREALNTVIAHLTDAQQNAHELAALKKRGVIDTSGYAQMAEDDLRRDVRLAAAALGYDLVPAAPKVVPLRSNLQPESV